MLDKYHQLCDKIQGASPSSKIGLSSKGELVQETGSWLGLGLFGGNTVSKRDADYLHIFLSKLIDDERPLLSSRSVRIIKDHDYDLTVKDMLLFNQELDSSKAYKEHIKSSLNEIVSKINKSAKYSPELEEEIFTILQQSLEIINIDAHDEETQNELYKSIIQTIIDTYSNPILCQYLATFIIAKNISFTANKMDREQIIIYLQCLADQNLKNFNHEDLLKLINSNFFPQLQKLIIKQRNSEHGNNIIAEIKQEIEINQILSQKFSLQNLDKQQKNAFNIIKNKKLYKDYNEKDLCFLLQNKFIDAEIVSDFQVYDDENFDKVLNIKQAYDQLNQIGYRDFIKKEIIDQNKHVKQSNESFKTLIKDAMKRCMIIENPSEMEEVASYIVNNKMIDEQKYIRNSSGARDDEIFNVINSLVKIKNNQLEHCAFMKNLRLMHIEDNRQASLVETKTTSYIDSFQRLLRKELKELNILDENIENIIQYIIKYDHENIHHYLQDENNREGLLMRWIDDYNSTDSLVSNSQSVNQDTHMVNQSRNLFVTKSSHFADDENDMPLHYLLKIFDNFFDKNKQDCTDFSRKLTTFCDNEMKKSPIKHENKEQDLQFMMNFIMSVIDFEQLSAITSADLEEYCHTMYQLLYNEQFGIIKLLDRKYTFNKTDTDPEILKIHELYLTKKLQMACVLFSKWTNFDKELNDSKLNYLEKWINNEEDDQLDENTTIIISNSPIEDLGMSHKSYGKFFLTLGDNQSYYEITDVTTGPIFR